MKQVCIGIYVQQQPERLHATLESIHRHTIQHEVELILLSDGTDARVAQALHRLRHIRQLHTDQPLGPPACFNRLAALASDTQFVVFLESGSVVGPSWLDHLLAALAADPHHGLAGPSTNRSWNEQGAFPQAGGSPAEVERTAALARQRFAGGWRTLEPLYSLADFCYVVKREVIETIGAADEGFGLGPCWEMDYNIRAARAGFKGVWAGAAYVWRAPFTPRRRFEEQRCFQASKQRYQDKFCALRLCGAKSDYEPHCRGDSCDYFAPQDLIQVHLPLVSFPGGDSGFEGRGTNRKQPPIDGQPAVGPLTETSKLITCIMPTRDRPDYVLHSIELFFRQDYPHKELIIVDDDNQDLADRLPQDPRLRYLRVPASTTIGAKRNKACEVARGEIIAQWDDDDWYSPDRLIYQTAPILAGGADITALTAGVFFDLPSWKFWTCSPELHRRLFVRDAHGGTLVFRRNVWEHMARYPDRSLAEDAAFLDQAARSGARFERLTNTGQFIYLRHGRNSWSFVCGQFLDRSAWHEVSEPASLAKDRAFYFARSAAATANRVIPATNRIRATSGDHMPLVSCIMPTADRRGFVPRAIQYFLRQDYPNKELIIIDDGADAIEDQVPREASIRYIRLDQKNSVGAKRNLACHQAQGEIILHWDDDDWHASRQISYQACSLLESRAQVCGIDLLYFLDLNTRQAWKYQYRHGKHQWLGGSSLCYFRTYWKDHPFKNMNIGEDTHFILSTPPGQILKLPDSTFHMGIIHSENVSPKRTRSSFWQACSIQEAQTILGADWKYYS